MPRVSVFKPVARVSPARFPRWSPCCPASQRGFFSPPFEGFLWGLLLLVCFVLAAVDLDSLLFAGGAR